VGANALPVGCHVALLVSPDEASMDRAQRQRPAVILLPPAAHQPIRPAIAKQGSGHGVAHCQEIPSSRGHAGDGRLARLAACTSGLIHAHFRHYPGAALEHRDVRNASCHHPFPFALLAALRTGVILGLDRSVLHIIGLAADKIGESHKGSS